MLGDASIWFKSTQLRPRLCSKKIQWHIKQSGIYADGSFSYEDEEFEPIELDFYTAASVGEDKIVQSILDRYFKFRSCCIKWNASWHEESLWFTCI